MAISKREDAGREKERTREKKRWIKVTQAIRFASIVDLEGSVFERNARKVAPFFAARHSHNCDLRGTGQLRSSDNGAATRNGQSNNLDFTVVRQ